MSYTWKRTEKVLIFSLKLGKRFTPKPNREAGSERLQRAFPRVAPFCTPHVSTDILTTLDDGSEAAVWFSRLTHRLIEPAINRLVWTNTRFNDLSGVC